MEHSNIIQIKPNKEEKKKENETIAKIKENIINFELFKKYNIIVITY